MAPGAGDQLRLSPKATSGKSQSRIFHLRLGVVSAEGRYPGRYSTALGTMEIR
jgi:hypothetical protein